MSFSDDTRALDASFRNTQLLLEQLLQALRNRRSSWISVRPSTLQPSPELEQLTQDLAREESRREVLLNSLRDALPQPIGFDRAELRVNVSIIAAAMPPAEGRALREIADRTQSLAKAVRAEVTLGQRLVRFAQDALPGQQLTPARKQLPGYDRRARVLRTSNHAGALVDGRM